MPLTILDINNPAGSSYPKKYSTVLGNTNIQSSNVLNQVAGAAVLAGAGFGGFPQAAQVGQSFLGGANSIYRTYAAVPFTNLNTIPGVKFQDFRARKGYGSLGAITDAVRLDGATAAINGSTVAGLYAIANATPIGAYSVFNREADVNFGAGWGDHGNPYALRLDFTAQSNVATKWDISGNWKPKIGLNQAVPFRGDRVQVIDFSSRKIGNAYKWKPSILGADLPGILGKTQDFIKFFLTGPDLRPGDPADLEDDIIVFRAAFESLTDTFSPNWTPQSMIGRADPAYHYSGYGRSIDMSFSVYATDRDEMKPIWRKLNALAGYTTPDYLASNIAMRGPWMRITIGDLYYQQPCIINSLSYTLHDANTTWEINIEQDPEMRQLPKSVNIRLGLTLITDQLPQKGGRFYSLSETSNYDKNGRPQKGTDNWLSDAKATAIPAASVNIEPPIIRS